MRLSVRRRDTSRIFAQEKQLRQHIRRVLFAHILVTLCLRHTMRESDLESELNWGLRASRHSSVDWPITHLTYSEINTPALSPVKPQSIRSARDSSRSEWLILLSGLLTFVLLFGLEVVFVTF